MAGFTCPNCGAEISPERMATEGRSECPFCEADLSAVAPPAPPVGAGPGTSAGTDDLPDNPGSELRRLPALPSKSKINVVESTGERLVFYIAGGGKNAAALGCFALAWCGFMCVFTPGIGVGMFQAGQNGLPLAFLIAFLALFWAVGLGMAYFWVRMKYERTFLLVERDRIVVQRVLFSRKRTDETLLSPESRAGLVESYQQNEQPVYRVEIQGRDRAAKFGTSLDQPDKDWIVDRINEFLDAAPAAVATAANSGAIATGSPADGLMPSGSAAPDDYERLEPADLPADIPISIDEDSPDALELHYPFSAESRSRWIAPIVALGVSALWFSVIWEVVGAVWRFPAGGARIAFVLFLVPFIVVGLAPLVIGLGLVRGRTTIRLTRESFRCRWHAGWLGISRTVPTQDIESVRMEFMGTAMQNPRVRQPPDRAAKSLRACIVRAGGKSLFLTMLQPESTARQVESLLRTRLEKFRNPAETSSTPASLGGGEIAP